MHTYRTLSRRTAGIAAAVAVGSGLLAMVAPAASAQPPVIVPPGCGSVSGTLVPASDLEDHSSDPVGVGSPFAYYSLPVGVIFVGSPFVDYVSGSPAGDTICGLGGGDQINGNAGIDTLFGNQGGDIIQGGEGNDDIFGGSQRDYLYGDDSTNSHGAGDSGDEIRGHEGDDVLQGGYGNDTLRGDAGTDEIRGDQDSDTAYNGELCINVETVLSVGTVC